MNEIDVEPRPGNRVALILDTEDAASALRELEYDATLTLHKLQGPNKRLETRRDRLELALARVEDLRLTGRVA